MGFKFGVISFFWPWWNKRYGTIRLEDGEEVHFHACQSMVYGPKNVARLVGPPQQGLFREPFRGQEVVAVYLAPSDKKMAWWADRENLEDLYGSLDGRYLSLSDTKKYPEVARVIAENLPPFGRYAPFFEVQYFPNFRPGVLSGVGEGAKNIVFARNGGNDVSVRPLGGACITMCHGRVTSPKGVVRLVSVDPAHQRVIIMENT